MVVYDMPVLTLNSILSLTALHVGSWTRAWKAMTLTGHISPDVVLSSSEDGRILVWDLCKRTCVEKIRRENSSFSILASHPAMLNRFAAGHDSGILVFKLASERPVLSVSGDSMCRYFNTVSGFHFELSNFQNWRYSLINLVSPRQRHYWDYCPYFYQHAKALFRCGQGFLSTVLDKRTNQIFVKNLKNETVEKIALPILTDAIFYAGTRKLLCRAEDRAFILDLQNRIILRELQTCLVIKRVFWSNDMEFVAFLSKNSIVVASTELVHQCTLHETTHVKSGAWDDNDYCLPNGDSGIIKSIDLPLFISKVFGSIIRCSNVEGRAHDIEFDATEYVIKLFLLKKRYSQVMRMIRRSELCRHVVITYLQQKGFPAIALRLAKDGKTRLNLALESGDIQAAVTSAKELDDEKDHWCRLGVEAFRQDNDNVKFQFQNALYLGDKRDCVKILENAGELHLAYVTAAVHGLRETAKRLATELGENVPYLPSAGKSPSLLVPPRPIVCGGDWPLLSVLGGEHLQHGNVKHGLRKRL
ncbi:Coatomer alpha subunit [Parasponia andersonii]|uniref:Coatomer alpha subunit n=1 Tax=Parasponia andersonii TaxID=3476 RepID=A0A2P5E472_PARAD|nr:Coatomer alpha subunit [Parasponia andersonii]